MKKLISMLMLFLLLTALIACKLEENDMIAAENNSSDMSDYQGRLIKVSDNCTYVVNGIYKDDGKEFYADNEQKNKLVDSHTGTKNDIGYASQVWIGLNIRAIKENEGNTTSIVLDLGTVKENLFDFILYAEECGSGIGAPIDVYILTSENGTDFKRIGTCSKNMIKSKEDKDYPTMGIYRYCLLTDTGITARYVKFEIKHQYNWVFTSEIEVYQGIDGYKPESEVGVYIESETESREAKQTDQLFNFDINNIDEKLVAETGAIYTNAESLKAGGITWSILIHCRNIGTNKYEVKTDAINCSGSKPQLDFEEGDIVIAIHSATSNPENKDYKNVKQKLQALQVKSGWIVELEGIDLVNKTVDCGIAVCKNY